MINCHIKPGKLRQYYSVRWMNGTSTIITSTSPPESPRYQLNDNFSLIISDIQLGDSSTSYRCTVTIDDPNIPGTSNRVYNRLGNITVNVYGTPFLMYFGMYYWCVYQCMTLPMVLLLGEGGGGGGVVSVTSALLI